jgi:hypothetical protein
MRNEKCLTLLFLPARAKDQRQHVQLAALFRLCPFLYRDELDVRLFEVHRLGSTLIPVFQ